MIIFLFFVLGLTFCWTKGKTGLLLSTFVVWFLIVVFAKPFFNKSIKKKREKKTMPSLLFRFVHLSRRRRRRRRRKDVHLLHHTTTRILLLSKA
jgi:hypothetical protein